MWEAAWDLMLPLPPSLLEMIRRSYCNSFNSDLSPSPLLIIVYQYKQSSRCLSLQRGLSTALRLVYYCPSNQ